MAGEAVSIPSYVVSFLYSRAKILKTVSYISLALVFTSKLNRVGT